MPYNKLTREEEYVLLEKGTEPAFSGDFIGEKAPKVEGVFICRQCNQPLYDTNMKFDSGCGWPSFDDDLPESVKRVPDADGRRVEIVCSNCEGHLGHVFQGEGFTPKDTRHCVNSLSIKFVKASDKAPEPIK